MTPILCFGEALLDMLPSGAVPGGAPLNVAYHLHQFGSRAAIFTRIGMDTNGQLLQQFLADKQLDSSYVQSDAHLPTGVVQVHFQNNEPYYHIVESVAWDAIASVSIPKETPMLVHGSLSLRNEQNRQTLQRLISQSNAKVVFDVNFRAPFYSQGIIREWLSKADFAKVNEHELAEMLGWFECADAHELRKAFPNLALLIVTKGGAGAEVITSTEQLSHPGFRVQVADTVGSGDAFLAAFLHFYLAGESLSSALKKACATGAFVASCAGATPTYQQEEIFRKFGL